MSINADDFTRKELLALAESKGITEFPEAKKPTYPTKEEIVKEIETFDKEFSYLSKNADKEVVKPKRKKRKTARELKQELLALKRVIVRERRHIMDYQNDNSNRVIFITWGNAIVGFHTNRVIFDRPWFLPVGCIKNLEQVEYRPIDNKRTSVAQTLPPTKAYSIEYLPLPTKEELNKIAERQRLREARGEA